MWSYNGLSLCMVLEHMSLNKFVLKQFDLTWLLKLHIMVWFIYYANNGTVLQIDVSVSFLRKTCIGMITNYKDLQTFRHIEWGGLVRV